jgi:hypothetical protein
MLDLSTEHTRLAPGTRRTPCTFGYRGASDMTDGADLEKLAVKGRQVRASQVEGADAL